MSAPSLCSALAIAESSTLFIISAALIAFAMAARLAGLHPWTLVARLDSFVIGSLMGVLIYADVDLSPAISACKKLFYKIYLESIENYM